jgi:[ribosomal protein S5]-alanine N-acetyltransferase
MTPSPHAQPLNAPELLQGARARLRRSTPRDAQALFEMAHDPLVMQYMDWPAQLAQGEAWAFLDAAIQRWQDGSEYHWMIEDASTGAALGSINCRARGFAAEFGFLLAPRAWGRGLATESAQLLVGWLKGRPPIQRIWATTDAMNTRAGAVLERAGLRHEGLLRMATRRPAFGAAARDTRIYGLCRDDF